MVHKLRNSQRDGKPILAKDIAHWNDETPTVPSDGTGFSLSTTC